MWIFVEFVNRLKVSLDVNSSDTIGAVKAKIQDRLGQGRLNVYGRFSFMKQDFAESDTIADVKLKIVDQEGGLPADFDSLTFSYLLGSCMLTVHIALLSGKTIVLEVSNNDIIYNVKTKLQDAVCIPVGEQRLMYVHQELHNGRAVDDYLIPDNATLQLVRAPSPRYADFRDVYDCEESENEDDSEYPRP
jgi:ubiquitin C